MSQVVLVSEFGCIYIDASMIGRLLQWWSLIFVVVEKLISEYGCDVNDRDNDGLTPLHVAALSCKEQW